MDYTDTNTVDRSHTQEVLATGGDDGLIRLFKYPCYIEKADNKQYSGHSSHLTKVKFSANDEHLISTGGKDMTVLVWDTDLGSGPVPEMAL
jgi:WD40 repeat protein